MQSQARVLIVERDPIYRTGLAQVLGTMNDIAVVGQSAKPFDALELCRSAAPDVAVMSAEDWDDAIAALRAICNSHPQVRVIVLTREESAEPAAVPLQAGAKAYLSKCISGRELAECIRAVMRGSKVVSPALAARLMLETGHDERIEMLTTRERQVLAIVGRGLTNKEVARELDLSEKTVKQYMSNIMDKLQVRNRVEAAIVARRLKTGP